MSDREEKGFAGRVYESVSSAVGSAVDSVKGYLGRRGETKKRKREEKNLEREKQRVVDEKKEREIQSKLPEVREAMEYAIEKQKKHVKKNWFKRRFVPGSAAALLAFGAHKEYIHEPVKNTAEIVLYTADATQRLGRAAKRLGEEIVGRGTEGARFERAQKEFEAADEEYFGSIRELMDTYGQNLKEACD